MNDKYIGNKYGKLTVISFHSYKDLKRGKDKAYLCKCECGENSVVRIRTLKNGNTKTCGKCPKPIGNKHSEWEGYGELSKDLWNSYKHSAKARDIEYHLSIEEAWDLFLKQNRRCALTGLPLTFPPSYKEKKNKTASLDRIDSCGHYTIGNVQWVHRDVNKLKKNMDNDLFIEICTLVANNH